MHTKVHHLCVHALTMWAPPRAYVHVGLQKPCKESFMTKAHEELISHHLERALHPSMNIIKGQQGSFSKTHQIH